MKVGPKEQQVRDLKAAREKEDRGGRSARMTTLRAMVNAVDGPKKKPNLDQALALAQGRVVDAALLGPALEFGRTTPKVPAPAIAKTPSSK